MSYLLMCVAILFCAANSCLLRAYGSKKDAPAGVFGFNCLVSVGWGIILTVLFSAGDRAISPLAALFGTVYGLLLAAFLLFKNLAMGSGNLALTTLIASCAFLIPTAYSVCFTDESVSAAQLAGIAALLGALALCVLGKPSKGFTARWAVNSFLLFLTGGAVGVFYKIFGASLAAGETNAMLLTASIVSALLFGIAARAMNGKDAVRPDRRTVLFAALSAMTSCVYIRLNLALAESDPRRGLLPGQQRRGSTARGSVRACVLRREAQKSADCRHRARRRFNRGHRLRRVTRSDIGGWAGKVHDDAAPGAASIASIDPTI